MAAITNQNGGLQFAGGKDLVEYSLLIGGLNASNNALKHYTPLVTGYNRLFVVRPPWFVIDYFKTGAGGSSGWYSPESLWIQAKHILEYAFLSVTGFQDSQVDTDPLTGGYAGRTLNIPTGRSGHTTTITVTVPEFSGSPMRQVFRDVWMNGMIDEISGATTYQGKVAVDRHNNPMYLPSNIAPNTNGAGIGKPVNEAYHSAEIIYVQTDRSLANVENAVMCAHVYPTQVTREINYNAGGDHALVNCAITFNVVVYNSNPVTAIADKLLKQYYISCNSMNMNPELGSIFMDDGSIDMDRVGKLPQERNSGTLLGNAPVYTYNSTFVPRPYREVELNAGQSYNPSQEPFNSPKFSPLAQGKVVNNY